MGDKSKDDMETFEKFEKKNEHLGSCFILLISIKFLISLKNS